MNRKGFTLVELLAVLVILSAIMFVVFPSISSSMERAKKKKMDSSKKLLIAAAEMYVSDHRYAILKKGICYIVLDDLVESGYLNNDVIHGDDGDIKGVILYNSENNSYEFKNESFDYQDSDGSVIVEC